MPNLNLGLSQVLNDKLILLKNLKNETSKIDIIIWLLETTIDKALKDATKE